MIDPSVSSPAAIDCFIRSLQHAINHPRVLCSFGQHTQLVTIGIICFPKTTVCMCSKTELPAGRPQREVRFGRQENCFFHANTTNVHPFISLASPRVAHLLLYILHRLVRARTIPLSVARCSCGSCEPAVTRGMVPHEVETMAHDRRASVQNGAHELQQNRRSVSCAQSVVHNFLFSVGAPLRAPNIQPTTNYHHNDDDGEDNTGHWIRNTTTIVETFRRRRCAVAIIFFFSSYTPTTTILLLRRLLYRRHLEHRRQWPFLWRSYYLSTTRVRTIRTRRVSTSRCDGISTRVWGVCGRVCTTTRRTAAATAYYHHVWLC